MQLWLHDLLIIIMNEQYFYLTYTKVFHEKSHLAIKNKKTVETRLYGIGLFNFGSYVNHLF